MRLTLVVLLAILPACASEYHPDYRPETVTSSSQSVSYPVNIYENGAKEPSSSPTLGDATAGHSDGANVLILQSTHLDRPAEVVGVVDMHEAMGSQDQALAAMRRKAAAMGADAVVGVEFHHGESDGEPTHLSGLAVRFIDRGY